MRTAVYAADINERYTVSRLLEEALLKRGRLTEIVMFSLLPELIEAASQKNEAYDLIAIASAGDASSLQGICRSTPVILIGGRLDGPAAFDIGASYYIESPATSESLNRALTRCLRKAGEPI